jgi:hypothetical protein
MRWFVPALAFSLITTVPAWAHKPQQPPPADVSELVVMPAAKCLPHGHLQLHEGLVPLAEVSVDGRHVVRREVVAPGHQLLPETVGDGLVSGGEIGARQPGAHVGDVEVVIDATGHPPAGICHALLCCRHGKHIVMVNVEADVLAGPLLARRAAEAGIVYSLAYGDQPALIAEMVDWARTAGFEVVCAGKGTKYLSAYHASTPDTVWGHYGFTEAQVASGDFNARRTTRLMADSGSGAPLNRSVT